MNTTDTNTSLIDTEAMLQRFLDMVRIDSPSGDEAAMCAYLQAQLKAMGIDSRVDSAGNLIADMPANRCDHELVLVWSGHMDVVPPCLGVKPQVMGTVSADSDERWVQSDNTTVLGADDKAALAPMLSVLEASLKHDLPRPALRLIFTVREETYLEGAKELAQETLDANFSVILDHTGDPGLIIHAAPSYIAFEIVCEGKSVHAGIMPEQGVNAIVFASRVIERLHLGRIDENTTANIGFFDGGKGTNIVPDKAVIKGELRGHDPDRLVTELNWIHQVLEEEQANMPGTVFHVHHEEKFSAYHIEPESTGVRRVMEAATRSGLTPQLAKTNGGSDNNVFVKRGLPGVVLSACYVDPHALTERVRVADMQVMAGFLLNILTCFAEQPF